MAIQLKENKGRPYLTLLMKINLAQIEFLKGEIKLMIEGKSGE